MAIALINTIYNHSLSVGLLQFLLRKEGWNGRVSQYVLSLPASCSTSMAKLLSSITNYASLVKFSHSVFAMPFAIIGFSLALKQGDIAFDPWLLVKVIACMVFARNAAMSFNRWADRKFDEQNPRTMVREIPAGILRAHSVLWFCIANALLFISTTWFINPLCFYLSPVALAVILGYSLTKRFTSLSHLVLGLGLALAPIGAYLSVSGHFSLLPLLFSFSVLCWVAGFDIIYALQDEDFDKSIHLRSIPVRLGITRALYLSSALHVLAVLWLVMAGFHGKFGIWYWAGTFLFSLLILNQHLLVKPNDLSRVNLAFFTLNGIGSLLFAGFVLADLFFA